MNTSDQGLESVNDPARCCSIDAHNRCHIQLLQLSENKVMKKEKRSGTISNPNASASASQALAEALVFGPA